MKFDALLLALAGIATGAHSQVNVSDKTSAEAVVAAQSESGWRLMLSPGTLHYHRDPEHRDVYMLGLEHQGSDGIVVGGSGFRNSFGQPCVYLYTGWRFDHLTRFDPLFIQVTGGLLYGYLPPYDDKVPLNVHGFSPGAVLSVGWQLTPRLSTQLNFIGTAALMLQFSAELR